MNNILKLFINISFIFTFSLAAVQAWGEGEQDAVKTYVDGHQKEIAGDLAALLALPNVADNPDDILANARVIQGYYDAAGFDTEILDAEGGPVAFFAGKNFPGAAKTVTLYMHFDGQPVDESRWASPPFTPTFRAGRLEDNAEIVDFSAHQGPVPADWRLYGRSASDDKAPVIAILWALKALEASGQTPSVNIKVFMDGAEEQGSPNLEALIEKYGDRLKSDFWLFLDGPQDQRGNPRVVLGVRGFYGFELTVYGPVRGLHSGHYGNFAPNPALRLAHLLASMRDEDGQTLIAGFLDEVRPESDLEKNLIAAIPAADQMIMTDVGIADREMKGLRYEETHLLPALNVKGLRAGGVGDKSRNIIDSEAVASIGIRMVPDMTLEKTRQVVETHIEKQGYVILDHEPALEERLKYPKIARVDWATSGYPAVRTGADDPFVAKTIAIMQDLTGGETLVYPILGGSLPLADIVLPLEAPFVIVPIANPDNSQHGPNENIRLGHLFKGVEIYAALLAGLGEE